jgi:ribulose-phosphate 3-epimerase
MQITPAVLPHTFSEITDKLSRVEGLATRVQIDICDGVFGREKTWMPVGTEVLPSGFDYEFDIMVNEWKPVVEKCLLLKPSYIVVHVDLFSEDDMKSLVEMVRPHAVPLGLSISNDKNVDFLADMVRLAQELYGNTKIYIQVMGIQSIGEQAQSFDPSVVERIIAIKQLFGEAMLQVDGGMTPETALEVKRAGAEIAVSGSYIFADNESSTALSTMMAVGEQKQDWL